MGRGERLGIWNYIRGRREVNFSNSRGILGTLSRRSWLSHIENGLLTFLKTARESRPFEIVSNFS